MQKFILSLLPGGANIIDKISCDRKIGYDINPYLIELFKNLDKISSLPGDISIEEYSAVRNVYRNKTKEYPDWYIGAVGFLASYNSKFFGGRAGVVKTKDGIRNYYDEAKRNLIAQIPRLQGIEFECADYKKLDLSQYQNAVIYCDIPYKNTTGYEKVFNHKDFWQWAERQSKDHIVLVSEQEAPDHWKSIWSQPIIRTLDNASRVNSVENLFIYNK